MTSPFIPSPLVAAPVSWRDIAWNGSVYVAVSGESPSIARSANLVDWTLHPAPHVGTNCFACILWNGTTLVGLISGSRHVHTSTDGITWTQQTNALPTTYNIVAGAVIGSRFVVVTQSSNVALTSTDGINWTATAMTYAGGDTAATIAITTEGSNFVACNQNGRIATSTNGTAWTYPAASTTTTCIAFAAKTGLYLRAFGSLQSSPDGVTWTTRVASVTFRAIVWTGTQFVACAAATGTSGVYTSPDGITWTNQGNVLAYPMPGGGRLFYLNSKLILLTSNFNLGYTALQYATTPTAWSSVLLPAYSTENIPVPYGAADLVVFQPTAPSAREITHDKGATWLTHQGDLTVGVTQLFRGLYADGLFVAMSTASLWSSTDAVNWVDRNTMFNSFDSTLAYNGDGWVVCSRSYVQLQYSPDGLNWNDSPIPYGASQLFRVSASRRSPLYLTGAGGGPNGDWVAISNDGGATWEPVEFPIPNVAQWGSFNIATNGEAIVGFANNDRFVRYIGGAWSAGDLPISPSNYWYWTVPAGPGRFFLIAHDDGQALVSTDNGATWDETATWTTTGAWFTPGYGNGKLVLVGDDDTYVTTADHGASWVDGAMPDSSGNGYYAVGGNSTHVIAMPWDGDFAAVSTDGLSWATHALPQAGGWDYVFTIGETFYVVSNSNHAGCTLKSTDNGSTWSKIDHPLGNWKSALVDAQGLVLIGDIDGTLATSRLSGTLWTTTLSNVVMNPNNYGYYAFYGLGKYLYSTEFSQRLLESADGLSWYDSVVDSQPGSVYSAVSGDTLLTGYRFRWSLIKPDGTWEQVQPANDGFELVNLTGNSRGWLMLYFEGTYPDGRYVAKFSNDGRYWAEVELPELGLSREWKDVYGYGTTFYLTATMAERYWYWEAPFWTGFTNSEET